MPTARFSRKQSCLQRENRKGHSLLNALSVKKTEIDSDSRLRAAARTSLNHLDEFLLRVNTELLVDMLPMR